MQSPAQQKFVSSERGEIFDLLSSHRRRYTIRFCKEHGATTLSELASHIAALEQDKSVEEVTSAERKRVYTSLQQTHLDRLEEAGMIRYDGTHVELTDRARELEVYLDIVPKGSVSWGAYYLGLSLLAGVVVLSVWTGFLPPTLVDNRVVLLLIVLAFGLSAIAHLLYNRTARLDRVERPP